MVSTYVQKNDTEDKNKLRWNETDWTRMFHLFPQKPKN